MTKTKSPGSAAYMPGKHEAAALRTMNEIERSDARPRARIIARERHPWTFDLFAWDAGAELWRPQSGGANLDRQSAVRALAAKCESSDVTLLEETFDFDAYGHPAPALLDELIGDEGRTVLCREGAPGMVDQWVAIGLGSHGPTGVPSRDTRFPGDILQERFLKAARVDLPVPLGPNGDRDRRPPVTVRHSIVARELLPKDRWGVEGRPDLAGRAIDRELAVNAAVLAEEERARKAGDWLPPPAELYSQVADRMQKEWAAQAV